MLLDLAVGSMLIVLCPTVCAGPQSLMQRLFTKPPPNVRSVGKESGGRGRGRGGRTVGPVRYLPVPMVQVYNSSNRHLFCYDSQCLLQGPHVI